MTETAEIPAWHDGCTRSRAMVSMRVLVFTAMIVGASFIAGCCGGASGSDGCATCVENKLECVTDMDASTDAADAGGDATSE